MSIFQWIAANKGRIGRGVRWAILSIFVLGAALLLAFGPRSVVARPKGRITIEYWEKWTGHEAADMQRIVDDFNTTEGAEKGIYVEFLSMSKVDQKTLIATAAGDPPDVAGLIQAQVAQYAAIHAIEPLDDLAAADGITRADYKPLYWDGCTYHGHLYGLISTPEDVVLVYNKGLFLENAAKLRAAGCDPNRAPRTLAELDRYATALDAYDAQGRLVRVGFAPMETRGYIAQIPMWFGGSIFDEKTGKFTLTSPQCVRAMEWVRSYSVRLGADKLAQFYSSGGQFNSVRNPFFAGQVAMVQQGPWMARFVEDLKPSMNYWKFPKAMEKGMTPEQRQENCEWGVAPFPSVYSDGLTSDRERIDMGMTFCDFDVLVIPQGCKHRQQAFDFIAFVNRPDEMEKLCMLHCKNTPLAKTSANWLKDHPNPYVDIFDRLASSPNARRLPSIPIWPEVLDELTAVTERVSMLQQEPRAALAEAQARLQARYDEFIARHPTEKP